MMLPEEYVSKCLQIATEALKKIATLKAPNTDQRITTASSYAPPPGTSPGAIAEQALNEMRRLP